MSADCKHLFGYDVSGFEVEFLDEGEVSRMDEEHKRDRAAVTWFNFCPHCGARLSEGKVT